MCRRLFVLLIGLGDYTVNNILLSYCGKIGLLMKTMIAKNVDIAPCKFLAGANLVGVMYNYLIHYYPALAE